MNVLFDTSIWVDHLRHGALDRVMPAVRGRFVPWMDAVVAAELLAGCRSKRERRIVGRLLRPFRGAGRVATPLGNDYDRAALALSRMRERGRTVSNPGAALLDALVAAVSVRIGAIVVTRNVRDFGMIAEQMPLRVDSLADFERRLVN